MLWDDIVGHSAVKQSLRRAVEQRNVNHAYLFTGPSGVGKFMTARAFAASLLCGERGCGACNVCRRVLEEKHPDVTVVRPAGKNIPVDAIRAMRMDAFRKPVEGARRVYIVKDADRMWEEGASTMLKVLEEPPGDVVFVLVTASPAAMLPTIQSRCQEVRFSNVPVEELKAYLVEQGRASPDRADLVARLSGGVLGRALDWCDQPWRISRRDHVVRTARALRRADLNRVLEMSGELFREVRAPLDGLAGECQERKGELADGSLDQVVARRLARELDEELKRRQLQEELRGVKEILSALSWWYRDILIFREGCGSLLVNRDLEHEIAEEAGALPTGKLLRCIELIEESMKAAEQNVPAQLNIESTLLGIQEALHA